MIEAELPDGRILEFPDGTDPGVIQGKVKDLLGLPASPPPAVPSSSVDIAKELEAQGGAVNKSGFVRGLRDPIDAGAQLAMRILESMSPEGSTFHGWAKRERERVEAINKEAERDYRENWMKGQDPGIDPGRIAGGIMATLPLAAAVPGMAAASLPGRMAAGAGQGAVSGALQPVEGEDFWKEKAIQAGLGAGVGGAAPAVTGAVSRVISPQNTAARELLREGVAVTPGQAAGGALRRAEESVTSLPIIGDTVRGAFQRGTETFNRATINRALSPIGQRLEKATPIGREAVEEASRKVSQAYDDLLPKLVVRADPQFAKELSTLRSMAHSGDLEEKAAEQFDRVLKAKVLDKFTQGGMTGQKMKEVESELGQLARDYRFSSMASERKLGGAFAEVQSALRKVVERSNPDQAGRLKAINHSYAQMMRVEKAAADIGAKDGIFTPAQFSRAVRSLDPTARKRGFAKGQALMQGWGDKAQSVLSKQVPDSGTPYRLTTGLGALAVAGGIGYGAGIDPWVLGGLGLASGAYSRPMRALMTTALARRPQAAAPIAQSVRAAWPALSIAGPQIINPFLEDR